ncbi:SprT family protein [Enterococcus larvae]|uniref:SprT family protein n=1 Tax=Enterococcus larvae TaxID=2794352 RepID=UPI003F3CA4DB
MTALSTDTDLRSDSQLQQLVEQLSLSFFGKPFLHRAFYNARLKTTGGRYHLGSHDIDFNPKVLEKYGRDELVGVIKHELCHYHLHLENRGYQHKDKDFKELLSKTGGSRYVRPLLEKKTAYHCYRCQNCGAAIRRQRRINLDRYVCGSCRGKLQLIAS